MRSLLLAAAIVVLACASAQRVRWDDVLRQPPDWYASDAARDVAENVLRHQNADGGWPKNLDKTRPPNPATPAADLASTIDNGATVAEIRLLARVAGARRANGYREAALRGLDYLLAAQYPNGGWPQFFPLRPGYYSHITFNDDATYGVMTLLWDVAEARPPFAFVDEARRARARAAVDKGLEVILRAQVRVNGVLTAWCAQHDAATLEPRAARAFEPVSLSGMESVGLVRLLMRVRQPDERTVTAIEAAVAWFRAAQINGLRVEHRRDPSSGAEDVVALRDPAAPPVWARFYEIGSNRPLFTGRDGVPRPRLEEIELERRTGYSYLGTYAGELLDRDYPAWRKRIGRTIPGNGRSGAGVLPVDKENGCHEERVQQRRRRDAA